MTSQELQDKLNQATEKVEKRRNTIQKLCKKLNLNFDSVMSTYSDSVKDIKSDYLPSRISKEIVSQFAEEKPQRDANGDWSEENYDYNNQLSQLEDNFCKLFDVERVANNWKVKFDIQFNKENVEKIPVLVEFLDRWENNVRTWYNKESQELVDSLNEFHNIVRKYLSDNNYVYDYATRKDFIVGFNNFMYDNYGIKSRYRYGVNAIDKNDWADHQGFSKLVRELSTIRFEEQDTIRNYDSNFGYEASNGKYYLKSFDEERLNKILREEKQRKYEDLCNRVSAVVGEITDVSDLKIGAKGDLDGIVVGTKGKAKVQTIGAGGYNIQCFHYRVLVHKVA